MTSEFVMGLFRNFLLYLAENLSFQVLPKQVNAFLVKQSYSKYFVTEFFTGAEGAAALPGIGGEQCWGATRQTTRMCLGTCLRRGLSSREEKFITHRLRAPCCLPE